MANNKKNIIRRSEKIDKIVSGMDKPKLPDIGLEWEKFEKLISDSDNKKIIHINRSKRVTVISIAASVLLLLGFSIIINNKGINYETTDSLLLVRLKDNSTIQLNRNSKFKHKLTYGWFNRKVQLEGEAFFNVEKNRRVFSVYTKESKIKVTGTQFNVKSAMDITEVGVIEGRVEFSSSTKKKGIVTLTEGLFSTCKYDELPDEAVKKDLNQTTAWLNRRLEYREKKVETIINDIENIFRVKILVKEKETMNLIVTGTLEGKSEEEFIHTLCLTIKKQYRVHKGIYEIY